MKQVFAAGPMGGHGLGTGSPTLTASSAGLSPDAVTAALGLANYSPPPRASEIESRLPIRLALLNTPHSGRVLTHITPSTGRYFAHTLLNVPPTADAQLAIQTWGSPHWQRTAPESSDDLPELPYLPVAEVLDDAALQTWLEDADHRDMLEFTLHALLGTPANVRIVLAASAEDVAKVVYAVTRALPSNLLEEFTFSTYETNPLQSPARLVGHETGSNDEDLPAGCYETGNVAFHAGLRQRSLIHTEVPFAEFAVSALASAQFEPLDSLKESWHKLGLKEARLFDLVFRLTRGTVALTREEAVEALNLPGLASWICSRPEAVQQILDWAIEDHTFATESFCRVVQILRQKSESIARLGCTIREQGTEALKAGKLTRVANAFEVILPMVTPAKANAIWSDLLTQTVEPDALSWEARWYLLSRCVRFKPQTQGAVVDPVWTRWLNVPAEKLGELLALDLPRSFQLVAIRHCLTTDSESTPQLARTLSAYPRLALAALQPDESVSQDQAVKLYEALLSEAAAHPWLEEVLASASQYPRELVNRFFEVTQEAGKVDADRLVRAQSETLLDLFAGQSGLDRIARQILASPPADLLDTPAVLNFLGRLREEPQVTDETRQRIEAVQAVVTYRGAPSFDTSAMTAAATALQMIPPVVPPSTKGRVFHAVATELLRHSEYENFQSKLEAVLIQFGNSLANDATDLYENLLREIRGKTELGRQGNLVKAFLAVALGAVQSPELQAQLDGLDGHAFSVASDAARRGGRRMLEQVDNCTRDWPKDARVKWGFLLEAVKPRSRWRRDFACVAIGAALASIAWIVLLSTR